jgi:hypothetical protein
MINSSANLAILNFTDNRSCSVQQSKVHPDPADRLALSAPLIIFHLEVLSFRKAYRAKVFARWLADELVK